MTIIFNALLSILSIKVIFNESFFEKFIFNWHFLFAREKTHVSISVFDLKSPGMVSNICNSKSSFRICVKDSSHHIFALAG